MWRFTLALAISITAYSLAFLLAILIRFDFALPPYAISVFRSSVLFVVTLRIATFLATRDWRRRYRYSAITDLAWSSLTAAFSGAVLMSLQHVPQVVPEIPRSIIAIDTMLAILAACSFRVAARMSADMLRERTAVDRERALIFSADETAISILRAIRSQASGYRIVGMIDDRPGVTRSLVEGLPIFTQRDGLPGIAARTMARHLLLPATLPGKQVRDLAAECRRLGIEPHVIPAVDEILKGRYHLKMREVTIDDLLRREPAVLDLDGIRSFVNGKCVLVTGGAGSIGSELVRQIMAFRPTDVVLVDQSEFGIFTMEQELRKLSISPEAARLHFVIEDIADPEAMARAMGAFRPHIIFHAAAYKHVPLMEHNPQAAVRNNIFGTRNLVDLADRFRVERFVMISTDKAVRPTNIMGCSKLIAEKYLQTVAAGSRTDFITVRFGNVLNSAGSVVPTFRKQIEEGGPVTVTHEDMERFFMTIPEAVQLVLQAAVVGESGDILILDMGEAVRIIDLAKDMIQLSGQTYPGDIDIQITGLRPGEKLYEELFYESEQCAARVHDKILRAPRRAMSRAKMSAHLSTLEDALPGAAVDLASIVREIAGEFAAQDSVRHVPSRAAA